MAGLPVCFIHIGRYHVSGSLLRYRQARVRSGQFVPHFRHQFVNTFLFSYNLRPLCLRFVVRVERVLLSGVQINPGELE